MITCMKKFRKNILISFLTKIEGELILHKEALDSDLTDGDLVSLSLSSDFTTKFVLAFSNTCIN